MAGSFTGFCIGLLGQNWTFDAEYLLTSNPFQRTTLFDYSDYTDGILLRARWVDGLYVQRNQQQFLVDTDVFNGAENTDGAFVPVRITSSSDGTMGSVKVYANGELQEDVFFIAPLSPANKEILIGAAHYNAREGLDGQVRNIRITKESLNVTYGHLE